MHINVLHKSHVAILRPTTSKVTIDGQDYFSKEFYIEWEVLQCDVCKGL